jgi:hypothetical protein
MARVLPTSREAIGKCNDRKRELEGSFLEFFGLRFMPLCHASSMPRMFSEESTTEHFK